ncbi:MAG TPA: hypothetical protein VF522_23315 [Ramlibacter sp.]|uniref:hypothetical protein n=1 Tax=Ramlibacter sp. TaxID=1917967 RepID=UPI002ED0A5CA
MMHVRDPLDLLPLRQMVTARGDAALVFARPGLLDGLSRPDRYRIAGHDQGGQILAASEFALADARLLLQQAYGDLVGFGAPTVHTYVDAAAQSLMVPIMFLRIDAPRPHMLQLLEILQARRARWFEKETPRDRVVIRAELAFSRAHGLQRQLLELTDGSAHCLSWLLGYERSLQEGKAGSAKDAGVHA